MGSVYERKLSSVVPAITSGDNKTHQLKNLDLIMKYHYLKGLYFFEKEAAEGFSIKHFKEPMFLCLQYFYHVAGRIRRSSDADGGEVLIKCNDSGIRIVEAKCSKTLDQWLLDRVDGKDDVDDALLVHDLVLGPNMEFAPLVFLQLTWFKCGGISIGLSWAHILGDTFTASQFINLWGHFLSGQNQVPYNKLAIAGTKIHKSSTSLLDKNMNCVKRVEPVEDQWLVSNDRKMKSGSINVTAKQLKNMLSKMYDDHEGDNLVEPFEVISALVWKTLAMIRGENEPKTVTICRNDASCQRNNEIWCNTQVISTVEAGDNLKVAEVDLLELVELIAKKQEDVRGMIDNIKGKCEFILYGAQLTFVDLVDAKMYDLELKGHKPVFTNYWLNGVGDEGTVIVLPAAGDEGGRVVNFILPETDIIQLRHQLNDNWGVF